MSAAAMIGAFSLSACSSRAVPATRFVAAGREVVVSAASAPFLFPSCPDAAAYRRMALKRPAAGQDSPLVDPLPEDVSALETTRCGVLAGAKTDAYDLALAEYRAPREGELDRFLQVVRTAKRGGKREMVYFRRLPAAPDERRALKAVCDWDGDGFPDAVLDDCGPGGCGATALLLKPKTGEVVTEVIVPPAERP